MPDGIEVGWSLNNLGNAAFNRGDLAAAEAAYTRALAIKERLQPGGPDVAMTLRNVGMVQSVRGNLDERRRDLRPGARDLLPAGARQRRGVHVPVRPRHPGREPGRLRPRRGAAGQDPGNPGEARARTATTSPPPSSTWGRRSGFQKDLPGAERHFERALAIREKLAPGGLDVSFALVSLSELARERGDLDRAESLSLRALAIREKMAPQSYDTARTLHELGLVARARGRHEGGGGAGSAAPWRWSRPSSSSSAAPARSRRTSAPATSTTTATPSTCSSSWAGPTRRSG